MGLRFLVEGLGTSNLDLCGAVLPGATGGLGAPPVAGRPAPLDGGFTIGPRLVGVLLILLGILFSY